MNDFITLIILGVGGYFAWKILVAFLKGLGIAGEKIAEDGPSFFAKVIQSIAAGVIGGIVVAIAAGADSGFIGPSAIGIAGATFVKEQFFV